MIGNGLWRWATASQVGSSHVREGGLCQDRSFCDVAVDPELGPVLVAVVSDGAGSAAEGARGAQLVCDELHRQLRETLSGVTACTAEKWLRISVANVSATVASVAEFATLAPREFAATLLCAVATPRWTAFAQIGDGAIVYPGADSGWSYPFWPQRGEYANVTSFVTDEDAAERLEIEVQPYPVDEVALFTDGIQHLVLRYQERTVHAPFFDSMILPVRGSEASGADGQLSDALSTYLGSSLVTSRTDDDTTLVLASRAATGVRRA